LIAIGVIVSIAFLIKKLDYNLKQILRAGKISLLVTILIEGVLLIATYFLPQPMCDIGGNCPTNAGLFLQSSYYTFPIIFFITLLIYLVIKRIRKK